MPKTSNTERGNTKPYKVYIKDLIAMDDKYAITDAPDDFIGLTEVNSASILHSSRTRFSRKLIYTACGDVLMALNPFERIPNLYNSEQMAAYADSLKIEGLPSHVYQIPSKAYNSMCSFGKNQSILISGESGAGKTEATKQCLGFLANIAGANVTTTMAKASSSSASGVISRRKSMLKGTSKEAVDIANRIVAASPILEAFGNAKTLRNPNSSRFGKWMTLNFNSNNRICGSKYKNENEIKERKKEETIY